MPLLRSTLIALSRSSSLRRFMENSTLGGKMSSRFVAGTTVEQALEAAASVNRQRMSVSLDSLGENVRSPQEARLAADVYHRLLDAIQQRRLDANVSVKLTQMGMDLDPELALSLTAGLVDHAVAANTFVRVDMEGSAYTQATVDLVLRLHATSSNQGHVGVVIQAYLYRSKADIDRLLADGIRIRLCKGAYQEAPDLAFPDKADVDRNFVRLMQLLLPSGIYHGIATHDEEMIEATRQFAKERGIRPDEFEFQMLYGVRRDLQRSLVAAGYRVRVYIPFGTDWYPYFMRRLAERPANLLFIARNFFRQ
ncbi:MAG TPA: proline dehydrogenase family protein [Acidobacteriaceae bacterium]|nr:proline dehydrogenase family protein [Acidobacteriaceae bacterium]